MKIHVYDLKSQLVVDYCIESAKKMNFVELYTNYTPIFQVQ